MSTRFKQAAALFAGIVLVSGIAFSSSIKVWASGESLSTADLNGNFAHIHNLMVGGHGARLVNADVNASAAIAHSKLATPALVPKAWAVQPAVCDGGTCIPTAQVRIPSITRTGHGTYDINLDPAMTNNAYATVLTVEYCEATNTPCTCTVGATKGTSAFYISCFDRSGNLSDIGLSIIVMDDNN